MPHPVASVAPTDEDIYCHLVFDVITLDGEGFLNCIDRSTGWSEVGVLNRRDLMEQVRTFRRIQVNLHGMPRTILCDREYKKGDFYEYCVEMNINLNIYIYIYKPSRG